jgi:hypothetical protein
MGVAVDELPNEKPPPDGAEVPPLPPKRDGPPEGAGALLLLLVLVLVLVLPKLKLAMVKNR